MAVYFSGTSTKQTYEVGRNYVNSRGQVVTANNDGSFGNRQTGQVMRGSSYNPTVAWYADGADAMTWGAYHNGPSQAAFQTDAGKDVFTRLAATPLAAAVAPVAAALIAPVAAVEAVRINAPVVSLANRGAFLRDSAWSGKDDPVQDLRLGGVHVRANPKTINGEMVQVRYGDNELLSTVFGLATLGSDIGYNLRLAADANGFNNGKGVTQAAERAVAPDAVGGALRSAYDGLQKWANANKANEQQQREWLDDANDVIDYKLELQKQEWDGLFTRVW